jgi:exodeoxyribonuclease VII small subunit
MADKQFQVSKAIQELEEMNRWFQEENIDLEEGLERLKKGKELIQQCRQRLQSVENEFLKIKAEFADEEAKESSVPLAEASQEDLPF